MKKVFLFSMFLIGYLSVTNLSASSGDASAGASLFQGTKHFENGGVACIACHSVDSELVASGGKLAMNLTAMGGAGVAYTIQNPENASSSVMTDAFKNKALTATEQADLVAFFDQVASAETVSSSSKFVIGGIIGSIIIFLILSLLGSKRKKESVNQEMFDRQLKSSWKESV